MKGYDHIIRFGNRYPNPRQCILPKRGGHALRFPATRRFWRMAKRRLLAVVRPTLFILALILVSDVNRNGKDISHTGRLQMNKGVVAFLEHMESAIRVMALLSNHEPQQILA